VQQRHDGIAALVLQLAACALAIVVQFGLGPQHAVVGVLQVRAQFVQFALAGLQRRVGQLARVGLLSTRLASGLFLFVGH